MCVGLVLFRYGGTNSYRHGTAEGIFNQEFSGDERFLILIFGKEDVRPYLISSGGNVKMVSVEDSVSKAPKSMRVLSKLNHHHEDGNQRVLKKNRRPSLYMGHREREKLQSLLVHCWSG
ncbi:hypothetical protein PIB30_062094 [Stylosanthes scabra]|uniref:Uncharacterized protein n=1 Tax=Stylosanthes scabra TaxID=79078 RepID=A0ABU6QLE7_9FABA|nr:hypothetical protein [Stylosanthes scabra]